MLSSFLHLYKLFFDNALTGNIIELSTVFPDNHSCQTIKMQLLKDSFNNENDQKKN